MAFGVCKQPGALIIDSQTVKTTEKGATAGKKINGSKRQVAVDTQGFLAKVKVHDASLSDTEGGQ